MQIYDNIIRLFPEHLRFLWKHTAMKGEQLQEIRLRVEKPVILILRGKEWYSDISGQITDDFSKARVLSQEELGQIIKHICRYSMYAYEEEMCRGFISADGGFRVGIAGEVILNPDQSIKNIRYISSLNIRIAHEAKGCALAVLPYLYREKRLENTLIISPPGCGKTTLLRDIVRLVSDGNDFAEGQTVGLVDERSEIAGCYQGICGNDVGMRTDVLDGCPKQIGMMMLLRSMAPETVAVDELGSSAEITALEQAIKCGCSILATIHGASYEELKLKKFMEPLLQDRIFGRYLILGKKQDTFVIEQIRDRQGLILAEMVK